MLVFKKGSKISKTSTIYPFSRFTNSEIDDYSYINFFAWVNNTKIGKYCSIAMNFKSGLGKHPTKLLSTSPLFYAKKKFALKKPLDIELASFEELQDIRIGNDVWIGANVLIMDGVTVGNGAIIGAHSLVVRNVPDYAIIGGVPGEVIKYRFSDEIIAELNKINWWNWETERIIRNQHIFSNEVTLESLKNIL